MTCLCVAGLAEALRRIYSGSPWVYDALHGAEGSSLLRGRAPVVAGTLADGTPVVVKRLTHGGLLGGLTGDRFLSPARLRTAVATADFLAANDVATPAVLFAAWRRVRGFVRGEIGFERIAGGIDASDHLFGRPGDVPADWRETSAAIGRLAARLHALGVLHGDLNLMNVLLTPGGGVAILDLDKAVVRRAPLPEGTRRRNLARLERSIRKQGRGAPAESVELIVAALRRAYGAADA